MATDLLLLLLNLLYTSSSLAAGKMTLRVQFTLLTDTIPECDAGLSNGGVYAVLEYRLLASLESPAMSQWQRLDVATVPAVEGDNRCGNSTMDFPLTLEADEGPLVQFRMVQWEHGGGFCNCWGVLEDSWRVGHNTAQNLRCGVSGSVVPLTGCTDNTTGVLSFCSGSASVPRGFVTDLLNLTEMNTVPCQTGLDAVIEPLEGGPSLLLQDCSSSTPKMVVSFHLKFPVGSSCNPPEEEEGVELGVGNWENDGYWIPLVFYQQAGGTNSNTDIRIGTIMGTETMNYVALRGYNVTVKEIASSPGIFDDTLELCDPAYFLHNGFQIRWLQTVLFPRSRLSRPISRDTWTLDNVSIELQTNASHSQRLVMDDFDSSSVLNEEYWNQNLRNGNLTGPVNDCTAENETGNFLYFNANLTMKFGEDTDPIILSQLVRTAPLGVGLEGMTTSPSPVHTAQTIAPSNTTTAAPDDVSIGSVTIDTATLTEALTQPTETTVPVEVTRRERLSLALNRILSTIASSSFLLELHSSPEKLLQSLASLPAEELQRDSTSLAVVFLLGLVLREVGRAPPPPGSNNIDQFSQDFLSVVNNIISINTDQVEVDSAVQRLDAAIMGSSILSIVEDFSLTAFSAYEGYLQEANIGVSTASYSLDQGGNAPFTFEPRLEYSLQVPRQLGDMFRNTSANENGEVRVVSSLFENMQGVIPGDRDIQAGTELASSIISTALQCGNVTCQTTDVELTEPVVVTIKHSSVVEQRMLQDSQSETLCVFWEFLDRYEGLSIGQWSDRGCSRNENLSNSSVTVCECTHLTNFAILLSAAPLNISPVITLSLQVIGYVGVPVSLVAMALTIATFLFLEYVNYNRSSGSDKKPLLTIRNFIHINLCISLSIAQIIFIAAVDKGSGSDDNIPAHCQAVAVLLHYFFLVAFMWMLMEGVVLYVALVKVFVERKRLYMLGFAVSSYGLPLLYMGLTLPLGFALGTQPNYGYASACYLNPSTGFIWAFIAPVIMIFLINCGFYTMAITIMCKQQRRLKKTKLTILKNWLKASVSLVVIMGLTWIFGVLIVEVEQLLPLAFIYTILVAFQGLFIFIILVPLSKQVRGAYSKWWRAKVKESEALTKCFGDTSNSSRTSGVAVGSRDSKEKHSLELKDQRLRGATLSSSMAVSDGEEPVILASKA